MEDTEPIFLPFMCRLRALKIDIDSYSSTMSDFGILSCLIRSLLVSLTSPATLEHIKFNIVLRDYDDDYYDYYWFYDELRDADAWSHLDSIITHPTGSRLQRVDINIKYSFGCDNQPDNSEILEPVLDALPLLRKKDILFVKANVSR